MDTLDAKTRIMNEIDSIDVQAQALQEKIAELHSRKNQFKEAYTAIIAAEQRAETLLSGLLKAADVAAPEEELEEVWEAPAEEESDSKEEPTFAPVFDRQLLMVEEQESEEAEEIHTTNPEADDEANGRHKGSRTVPSFLRQYL